MDKSERRNIMSKFEKFVNSLENACDKAAKKTAEVTDIAATRIKLKAEESRLCDRYEELGRASEGLIRGMDEIPEQIASALDEIDKVMARIKELEAEIEQKKEKN